ncbi:uncharacterized protein LOC128186402 [Crassostrea angulata]|uniref:uncharacterized protein LOC128186402 n=1 Tax=Magallana angulata TaxID=2784310 RepID=UPI0022B20753|nr:uncharacterized protein LOC128186402 [Crassostrea angulata]
MKGPFCVIVIGMFFVTTNGQCPVDVGNRPLLSSCEGMMKHGPTVFVDFFKISRPCSCTVTPSFDGYLLVISRKAQAEYACNTEVLVQNTSIIGCPTDVISFLLLNVTINQTVKVRARYVSSSTSGTFQHCIEFQQNGGIPGNLKVICGSQSETTVTTTIVSSTPIFTSPIESTSVAVNNKKTDVTRSSNTDIIAGSAAGGAIILVGLVLLILILMKRSRSAKHKERSSEGDKVHKNEIFDSSPELPDNPLYFSSQSLDELGYSSDQEKQLGLPPTDSKTKEKINSNSDVPANNKPLDQGASSMPVYAVSKKSKNRASEVRSGDVYAEVCKPNRGTAQFPV